MLQVDISAAASVAVQGRVDGSLSWITLQTITTTSIVPIARVTQLRLVISGNTGTVNAALAS